MSKINSFKTASELSTSKGKLHFHSLKKFTENSGIKLDRLPYSLKILLENLLRKEDGLAVSKKDIEALANWKSKAEPEIEIQFTPARVLLQDFTGVPAVADLAAMRNAIHKMGCDADRINPLSPADLVIDHSVMVDSFGTSSAFKQNAELEFKRNNERYKFLRWGQSAFKDFRVVPPDTGIVHQVNLEFLATVAMTREVEGKKWVYPDTMVGTDSHTTMINGLGCLGWGVGGIEAEAALLGQPCSMLIPQVVGMKLHGTLPKSTTATDLVLTVTQMLRKKGVVGKFVEFYGPGVKALSLADRATLGNMSPEYGATCALFPIDEVTCGYLTLTNRAEAAELVELYFKEQGMWFNADTYNPDYSDTLELDLGTVEPCLAGPARPQDRVLLSQIGPSFAKIMQEQFKDQPAKLDSKVKLNFGNGISSELTHGSVVIAAITSCTNTSNPSVLIAAGLLAKKAVEKGLQVKPWVKTSLAPGSKVVTDYLKVAGLTPYYEALRFHLVGYGCTTCIGNSGPLPEIVSKAVIDGDLSVASVLSGNRNFEGRISTQVRANYLTSPPLVVAFALAGTINIDLQKDPIGFDGNGEKVYLKDIWPAPEEVQEIMKKTITQSQFVSSYADVFKGDENWQGLKIPSGNLYQWDPASTYIKEPPFFEGIKRTPDPVADIKNAKVLALLGDSITTDHISPAGNFNSKTPAGQYLVSLGVDPKDFNSYGSRRGNHEVMVRGTFANVRLKNKLVPGVEGGFTNYLPENKQMTIFEASEKYQKAGVPLVILAGKEYGSGSSRDWAAKGPKLLGIHAVIAESYERIHRSNLVGMGILPLQFLSGESADSLGLTGKESFDFTGLSALKPKQKVKVKGKKENGTAFEFEAIVRIDTPNEVEYFNHGGILNYVLRTTVTEGCK